jgi:hypothetical protein
MGSETRSRRSSASPQSHGRSVIPGPERSRCARTGDDGVALVVFRVREHGQPERIMVEYSSISVTDWHMTTAGQAS